MICARLQPPDVHGASVDSGNKDERTHLHLARIDVQSTSWTFTQCVLYDGVEVASGKKLKKIGL